MATNQQSTRQLLEKIPNFPCLYRHKVNDTYYGVKKISGKRKEHSLKTTERKLAERKLKGWIAGLDKVDGDAAKTVLSNLKNAEEYFEEHLCVGDYYNEGEQVTEEWFGQGGERLGLSGKVRAAEFLRLCENQHPATGDTLTQRLGAVLMAASTVIVAISARLQNIKGMITNRDEVIG